MPKEYRTIQEVAGPLMLVKGVSDVSYNDLGEIELASGEVRRCKVLEINEKGFLLEVTNTGNGCFAVGERVQVNTDLSRCGKYSVGDYLRISFDGKVALSLPPQVACVNSICKTDSEGNCID